jgi:lipoprotein-anchoring transpeptidase ErfK/SrfK
MPPRSLLSSIVIAGVAAAPLFTTPSTVNAQGLIDFLWGGGEEWGGKRQVVAFSSQFTPGQIIVSFGDRRLYLITRQGQAISYPIAVPREQSRWQGTTSVSDKRVNPSWRPTPDMFKENPKLPSWVPGGHPMNPLGVRALYLGASTYRIHGTDAPWTIGQAVSKGCIRMFNEDVLDLYPRVPVGMKVTVTWQRFNTQAVASYEGSDDPGPHRYGLSGYVNPPRGRMRPLDPMPPIDQIDELEQAQTAAVRMDDTMAPVAAPPETPRKRKPSSDKQPAESAKPGEAPKSASKTGEAAKAAAHKPTDAPKSAAAPKTAEPAKAADHSKPAPTKPGEPAKSNGSAKAADPVKPTETKPTESKNADASKPAQTKVADRAPPTETAKPGTVKSPDSSAKIAPVKTPDAPQGPQSRPAVASKPADAPKAVNQSKPDGAHKTAATYPADAKPAAEKASQSKPATATSSAASDAIAAAQKAAEAAARAAEAARKAADAAKKAADDAKKASSAGKEPEKASSKSAAL